MLVVIRLWSSHEKPVAGVDVMGVANREGPGAAWLAATAAVMAVIAGAGVAAMGQYNH